MIKEGRFGIYNGKEYELNKDMDGNLLILTSDKEKIDSSFEDRYHSGVYSKIVTKDQLSDLYRIRMYGVVDGIQVNLRKEFEDSYLVEVGDREVAEKLHLERTDKYGYEGRIQKEKIEIKTEKSPIE